MVVKRAIKNSEVAAVGDAIEMELSRYLHEYSLILAGKQQLIIGAFAKAMVVIPRQFCDNAGVDSTDLLNNLRMHHAKGNIWIGVEMASESVANNFDKSVWNTLQSAISSSSLYHESGQIARCQFVDGLAVALDKHTHKVESQFES